MGNKRSTRKAKKVKMFDNRSLRILIGIAHPSQFWRKFCTCAILQKRDKYSLKNIGSKKIKSSGGGRKSPSYKKHGKHGKCPIFAKVKENLEKSGNMLKKHLSQVELVPSFSSAAVYWRLTSTNGGPTVEDINKAFDENIDFIRSMLPAYHTMTNTPLITFHQDLSIERSKQIDEALQSVDKKS